MLKTLNIRKTRGFATLGTILLALFLGPAGAVPVSAQDGAGRTREDSSGRDAGTSRQRGDQPTDVDALVRMFSTPTSPFSVGDRVTISIEITSRQDVGHAPFHVRFDPAVLQFESGEQGTFLNEDGTQTAFFANATTAGDAVVVGLSRLGRGTGAAGQGNLCTLHFIAVAPGDPGFEFARASVRDGQNRTLTSRFDPASIRVDEAKRSR